MTQLFFFKIFITLLLLLSIALIVLFVNYDFISLYKTNLKIFKSECECKKDTKIILMNQNEKSYEIRVVKLEKTIKTYFIENIDSLKLKCNTFSSLKRGKNQKVIGFSLYGKNKRYYNYLKNLTYLTQKLYPGWIIKIYHDNTILKSTKCEIECLKDENNNLIDNADFCDVNKMPVSIININRTWSAWYIHKMMWRWLPIGDDFVSIFSSRDLDSILQQREVDAVEFWMKSNKPAHIMRGKF
jgi:hypothetical protein